MKRVLRENGLSIVLFILFTIFLAAQSVTGLYRYNEEQRQHDQPSVSYSEYVKGGEFLEATTENWESEFLQMGMYVLLTTMLYQKGSAESNKLESASDPPRPPRPDSPWPVRRGGIIKVLYEYSLSLVFFVLFTISIWLHAVGGAREYSEQQAAHGEAPVTALEFIRTSQFWFESFQNWQSEFLAILAMVVLSIFLRQQGSPESKPVDAAQPDAKVKTAKKVEWNDSVRATPSVQVLQAGLRRKQTRSRTGVLLIGLYRKDENQKRIVSRSDNK